MSWPRVIADRYVLETRIGRGAMGEVWGALDQVTGAEVAVKLSRAHTTLPSDAKPSVRFEREGKVLRRLKSPFICAILDEGRTSDDVRYIVLERLLGETLETHLEREGYLSMEDACRIVDEILQALVVAHAAGVIHRDLSPSNVFLHTPPGGRTTTKVLDFGLAKVSDPDEPRTGERVMMGSPAYAAPEQLQEGARVGARADLYAVGAILFHALTGRLPYGLTNGAALIALKREHDPPSIDEVTGERWPAAIRAFLTKAMARTPAKRHASAEVALACLREASRGAGPTLTLPEPPRDATVTLTPRRARGRRV